MEKLRNVPRIILPEDTDYILSLARKDRLKEALELIKLVNLENVEHYRPETIHLAIACVEVMIRSNQLAGAEIAIERLREDRIQELIEYRNTELAVERGVRFEEQTSLIVEEIMFWCHQGEFIKAWDCVPSFELLPRHELLIGLLIALAGSLSESDDDLSLFCAEQCCNYILKINPENIDIFNILTMLLFQSKDYSKSENSWMSVINKFKSINSFEGKINFILSLSDFMCDCLEYNFAICCLNLICGNDLKVLKDQFKDRYYDFKALEFECFFHSQNYDAAVSVGNLIAHNYLDIMNPQILAILANASYYTENRDIERNQKALKLLELALRKYEEELLVCDIEEREDLLEEYHYISNAIVDLKNDYTIDWSEAPWNENIEDF